MTNTTTLKQKIKEKLLQNEVLFQDKVIQGFNSDFQTYHFKLYVPIPLKHPTANDRFVKIDEPSITPEEALDKWLDSLLAE